MAIYNTTSKQEFEDKVLKSKKIVLVDFWAQWCPPCRAMAPVLHEVADTMDEDVDVVKVDIEASQDNNRLASEYGVQGIPNMQVFRGGKVVDVLVGMRPGAQLKAELKAVIKK